MEKYNKNTLVKIHFENKASEPLELEKAIRSLYAMEYIKNIPDEYYTQIVNRWVLNFDKIVNDFDKLVENKCRLEVIK